MRCTSPRTVGFKSDGKTISWSPRTNSKEFATFQLPCGQCIECRLDYARQWAIRCVHEAQMYEENSFITLTYDDEHLLSKKLEYRDFQLFMKRLRFSTNNTVGCFVTGEYGEKEKRPHWHAIVFNWRPPDLVPKYKNHRGDQVYESKILTKLWGKGICDLGQVTLESAGYCARYAAKKLQHSSDFNDEYRPISKKSSKQAIGKKWLEKYWPDIFNWGYTILLDGTKTGVPRYYEKWLKKHQPERWNAYVTETKLLKAKKAIEKAERDRVIERDINSRRTASGQFSHVITRTQSRKKIQKQKFEEFLQKNTKL